MVELGDQNDDMDTYIEMGWQGKGSRWCWESEDH